MKALLLTALAVLTSSSLIYAQQVIPEGDFENWGPRASNSTAPQGWTTLDDIIANNGFPFVTNTVRRTTSSYNGRYAAELVTATNVLLGEVPGLVILGNASVVANGPVATAVVPGGVPYTNRASNLELYYKLTGPALASDSAAIQVQLTRTAGGNQQVIAHAEQVLLMAAPTYTRLVLPLRYQASGDPDTVRLIIASGSSSGLHPGTTLTVDGVHLTGTVTATHEALAEQAVTVYPTASADGWFHLSASTQPSLLRGAVSVSDAAGRVIWQQAALASAVADRAIDLRQQAPGVYILRLETPTALLIRRLVVL